METDGVEYLDFGLQRMVRRLVRSGGIVVGEYIRGAHKRVAPTKPVKASL